MKRKLIIPTPFGPVGIVWREASPSPLVVDILLSKPGETAERRMSGPYSGLDKGSCAEIDTVAAAIQAFLEGDEVAFSLGSVDMDICSPFQQSVLKVEFGIPRGMVSTYGLIAAHIGREGGARAVGNALATNPFPFIIPCHRAVRSDGSLGGY